MNLEQYHKDYVCCFCMEKRLYNRFLERTCSRFDNFGYLAHQKVFWEYIAQLARNNKVSLGKVGVARNEVENNLTVALAGDNARNLFSCYLGLELAFLCRQNLNARIALEYFVHSPYHALARGNHRHSLTKPFSLSCFYGDYTICKRFADYLSHYKGKLSGKFKLQHLAQLFVFFCRILERHDLALEQKILFPQPLIVSLQRPSPKKRGNAV